MVATLFEGEVVDQAANACGFTEELFLRRRRGKSIAVSADRTQGDVLYMFTLIATTNKGSAASSPA